MEKRDDVFAASSTSQLSRAVDFVSIRRSGHGTFIADCVKVYFHAEQQEAVYVDRLAEYVALRLQQGYTEPFVWKFLRMLPGQRLAGAGWINSATQKLEGLGYERCEFPPQFFYNRSTLHLIDTHMDDFHGEGPIGKVGPAIEELKDRV